MGRHDRKRLIESLRMSQPTFAYSVIATFEDPSLVEPWTDWLRREHFADVCVAGAIDAALIVHDVGEGKSPCLEARYRFADRAAFEAYEQNHAPRLREEGLSLFPSGVSYRRTTGMVGLAYP